VDESRGLIDSGLASENARQKGSKEADPRPVVRPKFTSNWVVGGVFPGGGDKFIGIGTMLENIFACLQTLRQIDKQAAVSQAATAFAICLLPFARG